MSIYSIYFSPTGGTEKVTDLLAGIWEGSVTKIDLSDKSKDDSELSQIALGKQDVCIIAMPAFGGRVPEIALTRLSNLRGNGAAAVLAASFGNRAFDDTLLELKEAVSACGFRTVAAIAAVTEHSIMHQYGTGRPDNQDVRELLDFAGKVKTYIEAGDFSGKLMLPGNHPFREYNGVPLKPKAGKGCTKCGICAAACPVGAIPGEQPDKTDAEHCISCMRCIGICPSGARTLNKVVLLAAGQGLKSACSGRKNNELFLPTSAAK